MGSDDVIVIAAHGIFVFQSTLPHGERPILRYYAFAIARISIHAPRMGSDLRCRHKRPRRSLFNPRSPHGERLSDYELREAQYYISIHAPRMGSDAPPLNLIVTIFISIHAPRMGSDSALKLAVVSYAKFQSTLPAWGATAKT